ncbi:class I SAM-dependent methyltransferase [Streptomyces triculaminicus]|uniref:Class I SAM-dependent methyltransferase n=1 Tax=Streptomyces triculaminicus TaxID=2816232 RepID=A0A939JS80_9ACTN|nr:class I SAM-dependent methyltransferase [Streptomyces triculaminicus]MBO0654389.1 class I SAM-dependent methyltransferase [Streptomyces triculaminicus]
MPTVPSGPSGPSENELHRDRRTAESFGSDAERYDRARPRYPEAMVDRIIAACRETGPGILDVLDVGCGTGIAARQFQAAGCRVLGIEPDARMADIARRHGLEVDVATFEAWDPAGRRFDAIVAAQAWHWIDPLAGAAKAARVLRPGGLLAAFWNAFHLSDDVAEAFSTAYQRVAPGSPFALQAMKRPMDGFQALSTKAADGIRTVGAFTGPEQWRFEWDWTYTKEAWLDQLPTFGPLTRLSPDRMAEVQAGVGAAIDAMGGDFTMHYTTIAVTAALR